MCTIPQVLSLLLLTSIHSVFSANILYIANMPSPSHHIWNRVLSFELAKRGHNVTHIGPDEESHQPKNHTNILLEDIYKSLDNTFDINEMGTYGPMKMMEAFHDWCVYQCQQSLKTEGLQRLLDYPPEFKFDLIVIDITPGTCLYPLIHRFNYPPTVAVTPFPLPGYVSFAMGNHLFPSYVPWYALPYTTEMTFLERVWNFFYSYYDLYRKYNDQYVRERELVEGKFGKDVPSSAELERHISLILVNTDPVLSYPQPVPPNLILVGGLQTRKSKDLPEDWKSILDNAKHGVILFSLGTNIRSDKLGKEMQEAILNAFSKVSETVIWKFESEIENLPKNVIVRKWLPQNDILGHPNVKLFIGHGGTLSTQETIFHGVPIAAIPFIIDQYINAKIIVERKLGVSIDFNRITSGYFLRKIREVLDNPLYATNMKKLSKIFRDRAETPLERGIFWIEYVLRHGGADFLNTKARDLPFYKSLGLDVISFLISIVCAITLVLWKLVRVILNSCSNKRKLKVQ